jgi:hypothetical protein
MKNTLTLGTAPLMDVVGEHSYSQVEMPEINLPKQMKEVRAILAANGGDKPLWHTEQGVGGDDDGYMMPSNSEADVAALYTRNLVVARSLSVEKYFWFSAQTSPTYGAAVFYENYVPRPRLAALNACASFIEGATYRRSHSPSRNAQMYLFEGAAPVCVVWNMDAPARLSLPLPASAVQVFDLMGNPVAVVSETNGIAVQLPAERPTYLRGSAGTYALLEKALAAAQMIDAKPIAVTARPASGGIEVTVTNRSHISQDGVVEVAPQAGTTPAGWPAPQHFDSLTPGESRSFTFVLPAGAAAGQARVRVGDREMRQVTAALAAR